MRVLLVEDDKRIASFVAKGLRENAYAVDLAQDGEEGIYQASINDYDVIILDVMMPLKTGFEVCAEIIRCRSSHQVSSWQDFYRPFIILS
jgi:two-component system copper resistance phosphate regulon response regulator CusR